MTRTLARRVIAATAPTVENVWAKALTIERRINNWFDANGVMRLADSAGNPFTGGGFVITYLTADATQCASSTPATISGLNTPVVVGPTYWFDIDLILAAQDTSSNVSAYLIPTGPATSSYGAWIKYEQLLLTTDDDALHATHFSATIGSTTNGATQLDSGNLVNANTYWCHIQGHATFSAAGNLSVLQAASANLAAFTVKQHSVLRLYYV